MTARGAVACGLLVALLGGCGSVSVDEGTIKPPAPREERLQAQLDLARGYLENRDLQKARPPVERALEIDPRSWEAHDLMARLLQLEGETELAEESLRRALRLDRDNPRVNNNYGILLCQQGRFEESLEYFRRSVRDTGYPRRSQTFENLGVCARQAGHDEEAREAFERAVRLNARQATSLFELGRYAFRDGDLRRADAYYRAYLDLAAQTAETLWFGVRLARALDDEDREASYGLALRNLFPGSRERRLWEGSQP